MILRNRITPCIRGPIATTRLSRSWPSHRRSMATILGSNPDASGSADPAGYCQDYVRKHDYESFLTSQFYPKEIKGGYFALKAFYVRLASSLCRLSSEAHNAYMSQVELAMIQDAVSNPMLGKMRMQFWRDAVKQISEVCLPSTDIIGRCI